MTTPFRKRIRLSLADSNLQSALDANAVRRFEVRTAAFESLPDAQELRQRAHRVRAEVTAHLESYLDQFITNATKNGMQVHRVADADQAISLVLEIAVQHKARLIAKSKTMVSEEIGLNPHLEANGLQVVETDLGEYIVQLRGEAPSHIITPAVHLTRKDVGRLFQQKLGLEYTEDISVMTNAARQTLRQVFLNSDIGVSGVNFGVAQTGTLCLVTNEGNGRMVTTLPPVHIALMGIERLVSTLEDLALMLSLLPRSATGQKLSVYTSLINRPRGDRDPDGPQERHVILVDNGRSAVKESGLREILFCIRCGSCLNACPVFREIGGHAYVSREGKGSPYPGPVGSVVSPALFGQLEYGHLARASSLCGACREACPVDIDLPRLLLRVRAGAWGQPGQAKDRQNASVALTMGLNLLTWAASSPWRFRSAQRLAGWFGLLAAKSSNGEAWIRLPGFSGWGYSKDFPSPAVRSFRSRYREQKRAPQTQTRPPAVDVKVNEVPAHETRAIPSPLSSGVMRFASELEALGGIFIYCSKDEAAGKILEILHTHGLDQMLVWEKPYLPESICSVLTDAGVQLCRPSAESIQTSSLVKAGLTGASVGIAETGSLLITGGEGRPLTASLLPEIHIALLNERDVVENLYQAWQQVDITQVPAVVIISGPSRTADIEMTLTIGVHGPGELYVICIKNDAGQV